MINLKECIKVKVSVNNNSVPEKYSPIASEEKSS